MQIVASYKNPVLAHRAVTYLRTNGIAADIGMPVSLPFLQVTVFVLDDAQAEEASDLLTRVAADVGESDAGWEQETVPDLSKLPSSAAPSCPACGSLLPLDAHVERCPSCSREVDVAELIAQLQGPEALDPCYPAEEFSKEAEDGAGVELTCDCGHSLLGSPWRGKCPACGKHYDKQCGVTGAVLLAQPRCLCGYALVGLPPSGKCPECGRTYLSNFEPPRI